MFALRLRRRSKIEFAVVAVAVASLVIVLLARKPDRANASTLVAVTCGQTIMATITVTNDLTNCPGNGLIVGKDSITITLTGRTIDGAMGACECAGVYVGSHKSVIVQGGTIKQFPYGVWIDGSTNTVKSTRLTANSQGLYVNSGSGNTITLNMIYSNTYGVEVYGSSPKVTSNTIENHGFGPGLYVATQSGAITGNHVLDNSNIGIEINGSGVITVSSNVVNGNGADGIKNIGLEVATFTTNTANYNGQLGIYAAPGSTDGNGNKGHNNGTAKQCVNVVCP